MEDETMSKYVTCGLLDTGVGFSDILCDPDTGDVIYCSDLLGDSLFSNITVMDPIELENDSVIEILCEYFKCDGAILSESFVIILRDGVAEYHCYDDTSKIKHIVNYDLSMSYEFE